MSHGTRITVGVSKHLFVGSLPLAGWRIQERLNDSRSDAVTLTDVEVCSSMNRECAARLPEVVVPKSQIEYVLAAPIQHEAPEKRWNNHTRKKVFSGFAVLGDCSISGELHLTTDPTDAWYTLAKQLPRFFAMTEATVRGIAGKRLRVPLVIANKDFVTGFHAGAPVVDHPRVDQQSGVSAAAT